MSVCPHVINLRVFTKGLLDNRVQKSAFPSLSLLVSVLKTPHQDVTGWALLSESTVSVTVIPAKVPFLAGQPDIVDNGFGQ